jgi:hypothetical protein
MASSARNSSSNRECSTMADAPASSSCSTVSSFFDNGEAEGTRGFLSFRPT